MGTMEQMEENIDSKKPEKNGELDNHRLKTFKLLKHYAEYHQIIEVIADQYEPSTAIIARKVGRSRKGTSEILKEFRDAGIIKSRKDERNIHYWSHTTYKGAVLQRVFREMCNLVESPVYKATMEEISNCINLINDPAARGLGLRALEKLAIRKCINYDSRLQNTLLTIIEDPSNDKFKESIMNCLIYILPNPLDDLEKRDEIEKMNTKKLREHLMKQETGKLNTIIEKVYSGRVLDALKRYHSNEPFSPETIPLSLTLMRMIDEEEAVQSMIQIIKNLSITVHYQDILLPALGLSTPMREKLYNNILELATDYTNKGVCARAKFFSGILIDSLVI